MHDKGEKIWAGGRHTAGKNEEKKLFAKLDTPIIIPRVINRNPAIILKIRFRQKPATTAPHRKQAIPRSICCC